MSKEENRLEQACSTTVGCLLNIVGFCAEILCCCHQIVDSEHKGVVTQFGSYRRLAHKGINMINPFSEKLIQMDSEGSFQVPGKIYNIAGDIEVLICLVVSYEIIYAEKAYNKNIREELLRILQVPLRTIHEKRLGQLQHLGNDLEGEITQQALDQLGVRVKKIQPTCDVVSQPTTTLTYSALALT